jgi:hypothetical protein
LDDGYVLHEPRSAAGGDDHRICVYGSCRRTVPRSSLIFSPACGICMRLFAMHTCIHAYPHVHADKHTVKNTCKLNAHKRETDTCMHTRLRTYIHAKCCENSPCDAGVVLQDRIAAAADRADPCHHGGVGCVDHQRLAGMSFSSVTYCKTPSLFLVCVYSHRMRTHARTHGIERG